MISKYINLDLYSFDVDVSKGLDQNNFDCDIALNDGYTKNKLKFPSHSWLCHSPTVYDKHWVPFLYILIFPSYHPNMLCIIWGHVTSAWKCNMYNVYNSYTLNNIVNMFFHSAVIGIHLMLLMLLHLLTLSSDSRWLLTNFVCYINQNTFNTMFLLLYRFSDFAG